MGAMRLERTAETGRLFLSGSFRVEDARQMKQGLLEALTACSRLVIDMADVVSADLTFYQLVCSARRSAALRGSVLETTGLSGNMLETAKRYGLAAVLEDRCQ